MAALTMTVDIDPSVTRMTRRALSACEAAGVEDALVGLIDSLMAGNRGFVLQREGARHVIRFRPFAELMLLDATATAKRRDLAREAKTRRIAETVRLAGY